MMEAASTSETLANFYQNTKRNPENSRLHYGLLYSILQPWHFSWNLIAFSNKI
jgi:hypothetical protein